MQDTEKKEAFLFAESVGLSIIKALENLGLDSEEVKKQVEELRKINNELR